MPDAIVVNGQLQAVNDQLAQRDRLAGIGLPPDLHAAERSAWRRFLPGGRLPWREVSAFEMEITKLEQRRSEIEQKRLELAERLRAAPQRDMEALAQWQRDGQRGPRPEPSGPSLENELYQLQQDEQALIRAVDSVTSERAVYVEGNRPKLVEDASRAEGKALERAQRALEELKEAREALVQSRRVRLWAELYPAQEAGREPSWGLLGGGLRRIGELARLQQTVAVEEILTAMRADVDWVASAATREQAAKLAPKPVTQDEVDRERNRAVNAALSLHAQSRSDERRGQLDRMKAKL